MTDDSAFLEVLASCTDACEGMDLSDDGWNPPEGDYTVRILEVTTNTKADTQGIVCAGVKPFFEILEAQDESLVGKTFNDFFWIVPHQSEPSMSMKNLCRFATCIGGVHTVDPIEAATIAGQSEGEVLELQVYTSIQKKGKTPGKVWTNIRYLSRVDTTTMEDAPGVESTPVS